MSNIHTVVIAPTYITASRVASEYLEAEYDYREGIPSTRYREHAKGYYYAPAQGAFVMLLGELPRRIVIVNYPDWRTEPGVMTALWARVQYLRDHNGTEIVWR